MDVSTRLRRAIASNDLSLTRRILSNNPSYLQNPDLNTNGNTSLHLAAFYGHTAIAEYLISLGHDTTSPSSLSPPSNGSNSTTSPGEDSSPSHRNANLLTLNPSSLGISHNIHNSTPLHLAAANGHTQTIHLLCHHFPQTINRQDNDGATPLMLASRGYPAFATTGGSHSSFQPSINPFSGSSTTTPLSTATVSSNNTPMTATDSSDPSALLTLLSPPHPSTTSASVHIRDIHGNTCLHYASAWGNLKALRLLIQAGADPLASNNAHWTPQYYSLTVQAEVYYKGLVAEWERLRRGLPAPMPSAGDGRAGARKMGEERRGVAQGQAAIKGGGMVRLVTREDDEDEGSEDNEEMATRGRSGSSNTVGRVRGHSDGMGELGVSLGRVDTWK